MDVTIYRNPRAVVLQGFVLCIPVTMQRMKHTATRIFIKTHYVELLQVGPSMR